MAVHGHVTAAQVGIVHQVVVEQCIVVVGLQGAGGHKDRLWVVLVEIVRQQHERGADAFATQREYILDGFIKTKRFSVIRQMLKEFIELGKNFVGCHHNYLVLGILQLKHYGDGE